MKGNAQKNVIAQPTPARHAKTAAALIACIGTFCLAPIDARAEDPPGKGVKITASTSTSLEGWFKEIIVLKGLEKLGYTTEMPRTVSVPAEHQGTATGDRTYTFDHWTPLHSPFPESIKNIATKGGAKMLVRAMALDLAAHGVRVNALAP